jgi:hypothetical protein
LFSHVREIILSPHLPDLKDGTTSQNPKDLDAGQLDVNEDASSSITISKEIYISRYNLIRTLVLICLSPSNSFGSMGDAKSIVNPSGSKI